MIAQLEEAKARADEFRGRSSRWQVTLTDGVADLIADMEHDLRDRLRKVQREAEKSIDEGDPGPIWDQITEWLDQRVAAAVSETFVWTDERSRWLSEEVAELFSEGGDRDAGHRRRRHRRAFSTRSSRCPELDAGRMGAGEKIYIGVRGSYGGVLMVGLATGLIGLTLINPLSLLAGVLVGRRAYREDMGCPPVAPAVRGEDCSSAATSTKSSSRWASSSRTGCGWCSAPRVTTSVRWPRSSTVRCRSRAQRVQAGGRNLHVRQRDERVIQLQAQLKQLETLQKEMPALPPLLAKRPSASERRPRRRTQRVCSGPRRTVYADDPCSSDGHRRARPPPA